ncbi:MAG: hypothetical protein OES32_08280 [Acidobacteriota bacterium]|nr:hypothetical protein [Acidobacteriota bacterium]MDH3523570.1 hypothetical protein [Acidobacteriota bacterium]
MADLRLELEESRTSFRPGETIRGVARWALEEPPEALEVRLFWYTEGKGDQDVGGVQSTTLDGAGLEGEREFTFTAPAAPLSFSGKLISLVWALELVALPAAEAGRAEIVISHTGEEILIGAADSEEPGVETPGRADPGTERLDLESLGGGRPLEP